MCHAFLYSQYRTTSFPLFIELTKYNWMNRNEFDSLVGVHLKRLCCYASLIWLVISYWRIFILSRVRLKKQLITRNNVPRMNRWIGQRLSTRGNLGKQTNSTRSPNFPMIAIEPNDYDFTSQCFQHCHCWQTDTEIKSIPEEQVQITVIKARVVFDLNTFDYFIHKYTIQQMCCAFVNSFTLL